MEEKKYAALFDTNAYRNFVTGKSTEEVVKEMQDLIAAERKKDIIGIGIATVGMEMLGRLVEGPSGVNYKDCLNGIIALGHHSLDDEKQLPRVFPVPYMHLANSFLGVIPKELEEQVFGIAGAINDFRKDIDVALEHHNKIKTFEKVVNFLNQEEEGFAKSVMEMIERLRSIKRGEFPNSSEKIITKKVLEYINGNSFDEITSQAILFLVSIYAGRFLEESELKSYAELMRKEFPVSVGFYKWMYNTILDRNIDMESKGSRESRWNWNWDYHVSFAISNSTIEGREAILVTADKGIREMFAYLGLSTKVFQLAEYIHFVKNT